MNTSFLKRILRVLKPRVEVGGLEISDTKISFFSTHPETNQIRTYSVPLTQGIIHEGVIYKRDEFSHACGALRKMVSAHAHNEIPVVVSISDSNVFTQVFMLPQFIDGSFKDAVRLNMQTISPIDFSHAYSDWQRTPVHTNASTQETEIIASFVQRSIIDTIVSVLRENGFSIVAIEQRSMSVNRFLQKYEKTYSEEKSYLVLHVNEDGYAISILCHGHVYFNKFSSWKVILKEIHSQRDIVFSDFSTLLTRELHQVSNFFTNRSREVIQGAYVISEIFQEQIIETLKGKFLFQFYPVTSLGGRENIQWITSAGAALRGILSRSKDTDISLTPEGTQDMLFHSKLISFLGAWRMMVVVVGSVVLVAYGGVYIFFNSVVQSLTSDITESLTPASINRYNDLMNKVQVFNDAVSRAEVVQKDQKRWHALVAGIYAQAGSNIIIERVYMQAASNMVTINAKTKKEEYAVEFNRRLEKLPEVASVELPLTGIEKSGIEMFSFRILITVR